MKKAFEGPETERNPSGVCLKPGPCPCSNPCAAMLAVLTPAGRAEFEAWRGAKAA